MTTLQFWPLESKVDVTFWEPLGSLKLHSLKLDEGPVPLRAFWASSDRAEQPGLLTVTAASLAAAAEPEAAEVTAVPVPPRSFAAQGDLYVLNSVNRLLKFDRKAAVQQACDRVWAAIQSGAAERDPSLLHPLALLSYCDLKHFKFRYWFGFPALQPPEPFTATSPPASLAASLGAEAAAAVAASCSAHVVGAGAGVPAWLVSMNGASGAVTTAPLTDWHRLQQEQAAGGGSRDVSGGSDSAIAGPTMYLAVADSSNQAAHPGWPLRNLLLLAAARWQCRQLRVLCLRERHGRYCPSTSLVLEVALPALPPAFLPAAVGGWEPNERGRVGVRTADLAPAMDPARLAEAAVELNLRLMRWRAAPALDVSAIAATRCLLLGAGTLGCSVARTLLGWGVRHITLVDNSHVAYSNPVRQSLYSFEDCLSGGRPKAAAAAEALKRIFPGVVAHGVQLAIPMPGHPIAETEVAQVRRDIAALEVLVDTHDAAFLLMDTRESRWLPTLLCAARGRLAINAALGFDGFMVMRHGAPLPPTEVAGVEAAATGAGLEAAAPAAAAGAGSECEQRQQQQAEASFARQAADVGSEEPRLQALSLGAAAGGGDLPSSSCAAASQQQALPPPQASTAAAGAAGEASAAAAAARGPAGRLGCYFCQDVVAPLNSTLDRSLDQQCTVARPGLSAIAGALAAELLAAVVAHPLGAAAPAAGSQASRHLSAEHELPLGEVPHMIRGQLGGFSQMCLAGQAFRQCTACSPAVVGEYRQRGHDFLLQGLLEPKHLEDLTGLTELHAASEAALEAWEASDEEEEAGRREAGGGGGEDEWEAL